MKILVIMKIIATVLIIKVIIIVIIIIKIIIIIVVTIITKCRGRYKTPTATNTELLVTLYNGWKPLTNIKKSSIPDAVRVQYTALKRLIHHLTCRIGIHHAAWMPCLELSPTWFLKNTCNDVNQHNNNYNNTNNDGNNNNDNIIDRLK